MEVGGGVVAPLAGLAAVDRQMELRAIVTATRMPANGDELIEPHAVGGGDLNGG